MTAAELEAAIVEAEKNPELIRPLIRDFKEYKDQQLSDLTARVNAVESGEAQKIAAVEAKLAAVLAAADSDDLATVKEKAAEAKLDEKARKIAELEKQKSEIQRQIDEANNPKIADTSESIEAPRK